MELRLYLFCVAFAIIQTCSAETIDITLPPSPPTELVYTLDRDPRDREFNCIDANNNSNTDISWRDRKLTRHTNPLNIYSAYEVLKEVRSEDFQCQRGDFYLGTVTVDIQEGGHVNISKNGIPSTYSSNQALSVLETESVVMTCSADPGEWQLPSGGVSPSFPVLTLPGVTSQDNNTVYTCKRIVGGDTLMEISVTLLVQLGAIGTGTGTESSSVSESSSPAQSSSQTAVLSSTPVRTGTMPSSSSISLSTDIPTSSAVSSPLSSQSPSPVSSSIFSAVEPTSVPTSQLYVPTSSSLVTTVTSTVQPATPTPPAFHSPTPVSTAVPASSTQHTTSSATTTTTTTTTPQVTSPSTTEAVTNEAEPSTTTTTATTAITTNETITNPTTITTTPLSVEVYAIPVVLALVAALLLMLGLIALLCCCLMLCVRDKRGDKLQRLDNELYTEKGDSLEGTGDRNGPIETPPQYVSIEDPLYSVKIALTEFKVQVNELWDKEFNQLTEEYNSLGGSEMRYPAQTAITPEVKVKNRYRNILPYDRSRVLLDGDPSVPGSDYINASHIPGILAPQRFISSQGPKENTVADFWQMLWENRIRHVVMVTREMEGGRKKCDQYWPDRVGDGVYVGPFHVTLVGLVRETMWVCREMMVRKGGKERQKVRQFQFTGWPDFEAPQFPRDLILFMRKVKSEIGHDTSTLCVHCSAGVGRSGTFIALFNLTESIKSGDDISIFNVVNELREYRPQMVQSFSQYKFIYLAVMELIFGDTSLHMNSFCHFFSHRMQTDSPVFVAQFNEFEFQCDKSFTRTIERALDTNAINPDTMVLPYDDSRVVLSAPYWDGGDYINASYVESYSGKAQFIATQLPVSESVRDLMQLIFQTKSPIVVLLTSFDEFDEMVYDEGRIRYWPDPMTQHEFDGYTLLNENKLTHPLTNRLKLESVSQQEAHEFNLVTLLDWTLSGEFDVTPEGLGRLFEVIHAIDRSLLSAANRPIVVQCRDGSGATGVFLAVYNSICRIQRERTVDIFQAAKRLRYCRQYMVSSWEQYISVHSIINSYLQGMTEEDVPSPPPSSSSPPTPIAPFLSSL